ncbi:MAG: hypothetical protein HYX63_05615 [Gammaproteobacteria bacterium]|nr:hypothetical protein [Gammaproteobacteria bacterium]
MSQATPALILGCGYLGLRLARCLVNDGTPVIVTTRTAARAAVLRQQLPLMVHCVNLDDRAVVGALLEALPPSGTALYCLLPPKALASAARLQGLVAIAAHARVTTAVLTSSTGIYDVAAGSVVNAETSVVPDSPRAAALAAIEQAWLTNDRCRVVRLAGLYGPGRVIGEATLRAGAALPGAPTQWLNLIEVDDAAALLMARTRSLHGARIELGSDGTPVTRGDYYHFVADCLKTAPPRFVPNSATRGGDKRCDPASTMQRLGWAPRYRDFRAGIRAALDAQ